MFDFVVSNHQDGDQHEDREAHNSPFILDDIFTIVRYSLSVIMYRRYSDMIILIVRLFMGAISAYLK